MVKVAICQMEASGTGAENIEKIRRMTKTAVENGGKLDVVCFPEYSYFAPRRRSEEQQPEPIPGRFTEAMCAIAKEFHVNLIPGSFLSQAESGKFYNTSLFINREGEILARYNKIHLFKAMGADESRSTEYGDTPAVFDTDFGRVGLMVCYDMRFPELARGMVQQGAEILFVPAFFPVGDILPPRSDHWDALVEGVALFNLTYTVAINQYGKIPQTGEPFGRSRVVDPWGTMIAQCSNRESIAYAALDLDYQEEVRASVATWENRRPEIYTLR